MRELFRDADHLVRVAGLCVAGLLLFLLARVFLGAADFGVYGHFRAGAIATTRSARPGSPARPTASPATTTSARSERPQARAGRLRSLPRRPRRHAADPEQKPARPDGRTTCLVCHVANVAKPASFPQIVPKDHAETGLCTECHSSHEPARPRRNAK